MRLQQIVTLRHLGFSLEQIKETLNNEESPLLETMRTLHNEIRMRVKEIIKIEWPKLIAETEAELERGTDPTSPKIRALAIRWQKLIDKKTGGDKELARGYGNRVEHEPAFGAEFMTAMGYPNASLPRLFAFHPRTSAAV